MYMMGVTVTTILVLNCLWQRDHKAVHHEIEYLHSQESYSSLSVIALTLEC